MLHLLLGMIQFVTTVLVLGLLKPCQTFAVIKMAGSFGFLNVNPSRSFSTLWMLW